MANEGKAVAYVTVRVDTSELQERLFLLRGCLDRARELVDELSEMELPVLVAGPSRPREEG